MQHQELLLIAMPLQLPNSSESKAILRKLLRPHSKLGKITLWFGGLALLLEVVRWISRSPAGTVLSAWTAVIVFLFVVCAGLMLFRWVRRHIMWRLRNRLIVTYVFIGVIPILLLVMMGALATYLFAGQFATYIAMAELRSELQHLRATNNALAAQFRGLQRQGKLNEQLAGEIASASEESFRHRTVTVWEDNKSFVLADQRPGTDARPIKASDAIEGNFSGFVVDTDHLHLRVIRHVSDGPHHLTVISNVRISSELLQTAAAQLGMVTLLPPDQSEMPERQPSSPAPAGTAPKAGSKDNIVIDFGDSRSTISLANKNGVGLQRVEAGRLPSPSNAFDFRFPFATRFGLVDWNSGKTLPALLVVETRPSLLYGTLFSALGEKAGIFLDGLVAIGIFFALIELVALYIGVRLTRSMTRSVADLYKATEHVNQGDLRYRIAVKTHDQMAALEQSFNSMIQSLSNLIAEQKEKQRLESELAIAHEVQALLFPADLSGLRSLEIHGICRPARTVSGDYYDFIRLREDKLMLAVGDISGKGISAALLMATVHAFVRAYSLEPERTTAPVALGAGVSGGNGSPGYPHPNGAESELSPGVLMSTLNYQLFRSTPPEKYATMFLGSYDAASGSLTYSNAGHLPPLIIGSDGGVKRLDTSGTVVGLFDEVNYDESRIGMVSGDIFIAYSDGITEPENEFGEFGEERLIELIQRHRDQSLARISEVVTGAVSDWIAGAEQPDDVTLVLARVR
jgi:sigma-B regulation protein RsbU (phosphoserine phosphatase)